MAPLQRSPATADAWVREKPCDVLFWNAATDQYVDAAPCLAAECGANGGRRDMHKLSPEI